VQQERGGRRQQKEEKIQALTLCAPTGRPHDLMIVLYYNALYKLLNYTCLCNFYRAFFCRKYILVWPVAKMALIFLSAMLELPVLVIVGNWTVLLVKN
jgi:hypothetical protein